MALFDLTKKEPTELVPGISARFVHSKTMTLAYVNIAAGSAMPNHSHPHEQILSVIEGELELTVNGETQTLTKGQLYVLGSNVPHSVKALTDCMVIDTFHPVREDFPPN